MKMYELGPDKRNEIGLKAQAHAHKNYDLDDIILKWDRTLENVIDQWKFSKPKTWELIEL